MNTVRVHGHRGARTVLPENTIAGFEYAIAEGTDWIEFDLWVTRDDHLVVTHDPEMNAKLCLGPVGAERVVRNMTLAELRRWDCGTLVNPAFPKQQSVPGARVPTLDEVFCLAPKGEFGFNIEIKNSIAKPGLTPPADAYAGMVVEAVRRHKLKERVLIQSFDWRILHETAKLAPELPRSALFPAGIRNLRRDYVDVARDAGVEIVSPHYLTVTREKVSRAHEAGIRVVTWTANSVPVWKKLVAAGVDEIITDDPAALIRWLLSR